MRVFSYGLGFTLALGFGLGLGGGCAAASTNANTGVTGSGGSGTGATTTASTGSGNGGEPLAGSGGSTGVGLTDGSVPDGLAACTTFTAVAQQAPAAMLIVLQRSASMSTNGKWPAAQSALVQAIDEDVFDTMSVGLTAFPVGTTPAPACLDGIFPSVYCSYPGYSPTATPATCTTSTDCTAPLACVNGSCIIPLPVPIAAAGTNKSTAPTGVRHDIAQWLTANSPESDDESNSSPIYDAMNYGYQVLQATPIDKRIMVLITDGGFDCTSVSRNPTRPGISDGLCPDWEIPTTVNAMITAARTNATTPVETFIVGVPGSNSTPNQQQGLWTAAPYNMLLALSTYAVSGSPSTVDPTCDKNAMWTQSGPNPAKPCHIDLSNGANFNAGALATAIATLRGKALGCVYPLPPPPMGQTIDPAKVNVVITIAGVPYTIPRRTSPSDMCLTSPCWDYDAMGQVNLIGIACSTVSTSASAKVDIYVGCATITTK
jgi:hypothetical protein